MRARLGRKGTALLIIGVLLVVAAGLGLVFREKVQTVVADIATKIEHQGKPGFAFEAQGVPDWWSSGNAWISASDIEPGTMGVDELPIASISVHECSAGSGCEEPERDVVGGECFAMAFYKSSLVDPTVAVASKMDEVRGFGTVVEELAVEELSITTPGGVVKYELHMHGMDNRSSETVMRGSAIGFIALEDGHIEVQGICQEASQLYKVIPVLESIALNR